MDTGAGCWGQAPARLSEHYSLSGQGVCGKAPDSLSEHCSVFSVRSRGAGAKPLQLIANTVEWQVRFAQVRLNQVRVKVRGRIRIRVRVRVRVRIRVRVRVRARVRHSDGGGRGGVVVVVGMVVVVVVVVVALNLKKELDAFPIYLCTYRLYLHITYCTLSPRSPG